MPLNLKYPSVTRKNTSAKKSEPVADSNQQKTTDAVASDSRPRPTPSRKQTDAPPPTLARKPSQASLLSTVSKPDKKRSAWRGVAKTLPSILKSHRGASSSSLVSVSQDNEQTASDPTEPDTSQSSPGFRSKIPIKRSVPSRKASISVEQDSANVTHGSTPQVSPHVDQAQEGDGRTSADSSESARTMVDELQAAMHSLSEELSTTQQQLTEATNESAALHEHIRALENTHDEQLRLRVEQAINHTKDELIRIHTTELENKQAAVRSLERMNEELTLRFKSTEGEKSELGRAHTAEVESQEFKIQNLQQSLEALQHDLRTRDEGMDGLSHENGELRKQVAQLEEDLRVQAEGGEEAQRVLIDEISQLRRHLEDSHVLIAGHEGRIAELQSRAAETESALRTTHAVIDEKEMVVSDLERQGSVLEERNVLLEQRIAEMEREISEVKESAQHVLETTVADYERRIVDATSTIQGFQNRLSVATSTIQQLQSALDATRNDADPASQTTTGDADELRQLQIQRRALEDTIHNLEEENKRLETEKAGLVRTYTSEVEAERRAIHNLRRSIETSERETSAKQERSAVLVQANEELRREIMSLKELRELEEKESAAMRKDLEVANATLCALEEKSRVSLEAAMEEKKKLVEELDQLRHQLEGVEGQLKERDGHAQASAADEEKRKAELQKANSTIVEQKTVIARLQQSIGEQTKEDRQPRLLLSVMKGGRTDSGRRRSSSSASQTEPAKTVEAAKRPPESRPDRSEAPKPIRRGSAPPAPSTSALSKQTVIPLRDVPRSPASPSHEASGMLKDHERAFQANSTDSDEESHHHSGSQHQVKDVKRLRQQTQAGLVYRMGHAVFGSLWRRVWG